MIYGTARRHDTWNAVGEGPLQSVVIGTFLCLRANTGIIDVEWLEVVDVGILADQNPML
jgi:hypothetical protein